MRCEEEDCTHGHDEIWLHAACHISSGLSAQYVKEGGILTLYCGSCNQIVAKFQIAP